MAFILSDCLAVIYGSTNESNTQSIMFNLSVATQCHIATISYSTSQIAIQVYSGLATF